MKRLLVVIFALAIVASLSAQAPDVTKLDFSKAKLSLAGPQQIYVRSVYYMGTSYSLLLTYDGAMGVTMSQPYAPSQKVLQDSWEARYAKARINEAGLLEISDLIAGNTAYTVQLRWDQATKLTLVKADMTALPATSEQQIAAANSKAEEYRQWGAKANADLEKAQADVKAANSRAAAAEAAAAQAKADADKANADLAAARRATTTAAPAAAPSWRTVFTPVEGAKLKPVTFGGWKPSTTALAQTDGSLKFAKYAVPFAQSATHTLYGFTAKAGATGWVGFGLHFFASGVKNADRYGFGSSYLVWLTRDEGYYRTKKAYVQLYQSSDDVTMIQLASANIGLDLTQPVNTEVVYNKDSRSIEVYVNGELALIQEVEPIQSGDTLAARTLGGGVEFSRFYVKTY